MTDAEAQTHFDDFFEEIFTEIELKYGEIEEMNICDNIGEHMIGNVYVKVWFVSLFYLLLLPILVRGFIAFLIRNERFMHRAFLGARKISRLRFDFMARVSTYLVLF